MNLHQLNCFTVLAEVLHYTEAAKRLYISQPSLSYAISELEKELGVELFYRQGNRIVLTKYGEALLPYAEKTLLTVQRGVRAIQNLKALSPSISLGYIYSISGVLSEMIRGFKQHRKDNDITVSFYQGLDEHIMDKLRKGEVDLAISTSSGGHSVAARPLFRQALYLAVPSDHPLAQREEVSIHELKDEKFVSITPESSLRGFINEAFQRAGYTPNIVFEAEECNAMASFVGSHFGVAIMPRIPGVDSYPITLLKIKEMSLTRQIYLLWMENEPLPAECETFKDYILTKHKFPEDPV
jgi:DNA-binding transcriptional LysR family regulator